MRRAAWVEIGTGAGPAAFKTDVDHARPFARGCTDAELARACQRAAGAVVDLVLSEQLREAAARLDPGPSAA